MPKARPPALIDNEVALTPLERRFADIFLAQPVSNVIDAYSRACSELDVPLPKALASASQVAISRPSVVAYIKRRQDELAGALLLTQESVLIDLMALRDMCMGRKPTPMAAFSEGVLVTGSAFKVDASGATKALELLGRYMSMWTDNVRHEVGADGASTFILNLAGHADAPSLPPPG